MFCYYLHIQTKGGTAMQTNESILSKCMFFTSNRLSNILRRKAEESFHPLGIGVPYVYLLIVVNQHDGISQADLCEKLDIAPSTCTRFVDRLVKQGILRREHEWKTAHVFLTEQGRETCDGIDGCIENLLASVRCVLGEEKMNHLSKEMWDACEELSHRQ